jgi:L-lactate utilization protein LutB
VNRLQQIAIKRQELLAGGDLAKRVAAIRENTVANLSGLVARATETLEQKLAKVYQAKDAQEAAGVVLRLLAGEKQVARAYSNTFKEIELEKTLAGRGVAVHPTRLEEIVGREMGLPASGHPHLVALDQSTATIEEGLRRYTGRKDAGAAEMVRLAREKVKETILGCEFGVTGANCIVAENGVLVIAEDEGNVRAVSNLPYKHLVVVGIEKAVMSAEEAMAVVQAQAVYGAGRVTPTYYSLIAGPSRTADIEFRMAYGMHGPKEVHVVLLDNGRTALCEQGAGPLLKCIGCGACFEACAALADQQGWSVAVRSPKDFALGLVQGRLAMSGRPGMEDFPCPVGLSAKTVAGGLQKIEPVR